MPSGIVGERNPVLDGVKSEFFSLKKRGDSVVLRILDPNYFYDCKHFVTESGQTKSVDCVAIHGGECSYCTKLDEIRSSYTRDELKKEEVKARIAVVAKNEGLGRKFNFYYKVLDRGTQKLCVFKTTLSVKLFFDTEVKEGGENFDITKFDYRITRSEESPTKYYICTRIDSSLSRPLSDGEKAEILKDLDLGRIIDGKSHSD